MKKILLPAALLLTAVSSQGALTITNGGFGTANQNARIVHNGGWYESTTTTNWVEGTWSLTGTIVLLMDGTGTGAYVYQSLGTVDAADIATGTFALKSDFFEKPDDTTNNILFDVYEGTFAGAAHGNDIAGAGLTNLASVDLSATDQGLTFAAGDSSTQLQQDILTFDVSGLNVGDEVWLRIGGGNTGGDILMDNLTIAPVPEPSSTALRGLGGLALILRRRK